MANNKNSREAALQAGMKHSSPFAAAWEDRGGSVGRRLREIRTLRGLSMKSLAEMSGLNINTLSLIENERTSPSVSTLQLLSQSLQVPVTEFFETNRQSKKLVHQKQGQRLRVAFKHGAIEDLAAGMTRFYAEPLIITLDHGANSGKDPIVHTGREIVYCIEGEITYFVEGVKYPLSPGDSLIFEAYLPHRWENSSAMPARALLVLCPMDERDDSTERHFSR